MRKAITAFIAYVVAMFRRLIAMLRETHSHDILPPPQEISLHHNSSDNGLSPKMFGIYYVASGVWRKNRIKNKLQ